MTALPSNYRSGQAAKIQVVSTYHEVQSRAPPAGAVDSDVSTRPSRQLVTASTSAPSACDRRARLPAAVG